MQHIARARQYLDRAIDRQVQLGRFDQDVVASVRVGRVHAERVVVAHVAHVGRAELAAGAGKAEAPLPLLAEHFHLQGVWRGAYVIGIDEQAGREQRRHTHRGDANQPPFQALVVRLVGGALAGLAIAMAIAQERRDDEEVDGDKQPAGDDDRDRQRVVHAHPVGGDWGDPPGAGKVKPHRQHDDQHERNRKGHGHLPARDFLNTLKTG
ncbi:hypothetical protein DL770_011130 [Monosporascus sp. CRB-9-2]|nr:hypothetical protein DL770_011130 [Monosporascus sp. CRB-9-2]